LIKSLEITDERTADYFLSRLNIVTRAIKVLELEQGGFEEKPYRIKLYRNRDAGMYESSSFELLESAVEMHNFPYRRSQDGDWHQPAFRLSIENTGRSPLWINTVYLGFDYSINADFFEEIQLLAPGHEAWLTFIADGAPENTILLNLDEKYIAAGYTEIVEYLKLFIATEAIDIKKLNQEGVEMPVARGIPGDKETDRSPAAVRPKNPANKLNWCTETIGFNINRPAEKSVISPGSTTQINDVTINSHPSLRAKAVLVSSAAAERSPGTVAAPHEACQNSFLEPFDFGLATRSLHARDTLQLTEVENPEAVTPEEPLIVNVSDADLTDVVAIGFNDEQGIYYPVGFGNEQGNLVIETIPTPKHDVESITQKSLFGSVRIYFQKIIGQKIGLKYLYPRLAIAEVSSDQVVNYEPDEANVKASVLAAKNILLLVHGIIGDTESIVKSLHLHKNDQAMLQQFDLVLAFDYENLNTTIEENARLLKARLAAVGLNDGHGKQLIIMAHSMGGLVSRWFIEKLGGNRIVQRLVMLGTPNNGTPWADVRDMAESLFTYALNGAAFLKPWMFVLHLAGKITAGTQVTFKQMDPKTGIYDLLNDGTDPMIPYTVVAGNTKDIIPDYSKTSSFLNKTFTRLRKRGVYDALDVILFKEPNDIAVTNTSITHFKNPDTWTIPPRILHLACDHMNYFNCSLVYKMINEEPHSMLR
jgi:pimeloyl-ACP methyl ester carboxylesterase